MKLTGKLMLLVVFVSLPCFMCFRLGPDSYQEIERLPTLESPLDNQLLNFQNKKFGNMNFLVWSPDGKMIAVTYLSGTVVIWEAKTGKDIYALSQGSDYVSQVVWLADEHLLATFSTDCTIRLWEMINEDNQSEIVLEYPNESFVWCNNSEIILSPDSSKFIYTIKNGEVRVMDVNTAVKMETPIKESIGFTWLNENEIISYDKDDFIRFWDISKEKPIREIKVPSNPEVNHNNCGSGRVKQISWTKSLSHIAFVERYECGLGGDILQSLRVWDLTTREEVLIKNFRGITAINWSPDGKHIAFGKYWGNIGILDVETNSIRIIGTHPFDGDGPLYFNSIAWSPDSSKIAAADSYGFIRIWEVPVE